MADKYGTERADSLVGTDAADLIQGFGGNDTLRGLGGADVLRGGLGNDLYYFDRLDTLYEEFPENPEGVPPTVNNPDGEPPTGYDIAVALEAVGEEWNFFSLVEEYYFSTLNDRVLNDAAFRVGFIHLGDGDDWYSGPSEFGSVIDGGRGLDTVIGGRGDDVVTGGPGADRLSGGAGRDRLSYADDTAGVHVDLTAGSGIFGEAHGDVVDGFENLSGGSGPDRLRGTATNNVIEGQDGADVLFGGAGQDVLDGGAGADALIGDGAVLETANAFAVRRLYFSTLGRGPDDVGWQYWTGLLEGGITLGSVAGSFVLSQEFQKKYGNLNDQQFVTLLYRNVLFREPDAAGQAEWQVALASGMARQQVVLGFSESTEFKVAMDQLPHPGQIYRLYWTTLRRAPDSDGYYSWLDAMGQGQPLASVANGFVASVEFQQVYGRLNDEQFVALLYDNVFHRKPDAAGFAHWQRALANGTDRQQVVLDFSESAEHIAAKSADFTRDIRNHLGTHNDTLVGGAGNDSLSGGLGSDVFSFELNGKDRDVVFRFEPWDAIELYGFGYSAVETAKEKLVQAGPDVVFSDRGQSIVFINTLLDAVRAAEWRIIDV
jgi:Ca2+-binding RTX toxin-like protein